LVGWPGWFVGMVGCVGWPGGRVGVSAWSNFGRVIGHAFGSEIRRIGHRGAKRAGNDQCSDVSVGSHWAKWEWRDGDGREQGQRQLVAKLGEGWWAC